MGTTELNLEGDKLEIINWVTNLQDDAAIARLKKLKENTTETDWWDEITVEERLAIDQGLEDIAAGRVTPHAEAKALYHIGIW